MPFIAGTPESAINRSDSKNPATTCRGITSSGRPCRRAIASDVVTSSRPSAGLGNLRVDKAQDEALYCWQHKEQASASARSSPGPRLSNKPILEQRLSLDTLAGRLGVIDLAQRPPRKTKQDAPPFQARLTSPVKKHKRPAKSSKSVSLCCFSVPLEEVPTSQRPRPRPAPMLHTRQIESNSQPKKPPVSSMPRPSISSHHASHQSTASRTSHYMSLIPPSTPPQTASLLMTELAKPPTTYDEAGYIYMFWLAPESETGPMSKASAAARSLLSPTSPFSRHPAGQRRPSDVLASFAANADTAGIRRAPSKHQTTRSVGASLPASPQRTILLKIGRASNVQRRLNEWKRQCGYDLSLIRYYPYISASSSGTESIPRKAPHSHKVERLIHIELAGLGLRVADRERCDACGREHREWFEIEASETGVMQVDGVIKRWVDWDEGR